MDHLWSPWRMKYIQKQEPPDGCVFCLAAAQENDAENLVVKRDKHAFVILNRFPYTNAHLMVVPNSHQPSIEELSPDTRAEMMELTSQSMQLIRLEYHPEAFNIGANIGAAAGAGVAEHVHIHIVPRWAGDTNFMSAVGETRVLPEELDETYRRLAQHWK